MLKTKTFLHDDAEVWQAFKAGSKEAYSLIYDTHLSGLYNYGMHLSQEKELVEDSIQDLFIDIWKSRDTLGDVKNIKFYLFKALKRKIVNRLVEQRKFVSEDDIMSGYNFEMVLPHEYTLISEETEYEKREKVLNLLKALTPRQREAVFLRFYDGLSYEEIAFMMSLTVNSVYNLISKAIELLRRYINGAFILPSSLSWFLFLFWHSFYYFSFL